jgi:hypothetical protein
LAVFDDLVKIFATSMSRDFCDMTDKEKAELPEKINDEAFKVMHERRRRYPKT